MTLAQNATFYRRVKDLLDSWGWGKATELYPGWATRSNSGVTMMPQAVTVHHTGGRATATSYLVDPRDRPQLKVLANIHITHGHQIRFIAAGGASHGGYTHEPCYQRVVQGTAPLDRDLDPGADSRTFSINKRTVGIEIDGAGGPKEWDEWTYRAAVATSAACQVAGGWPVKASPRVGAHKEHTRRKPGDPYAPMGKFRRDVLDCLANPWTPTGYLNPTDKENDDMPSPADLFNADIIPAPKESVAKGNEFWTLATFLGAIYENSLAARRAAGEARGIAKAFAAKSLTAEEIAAAAREGAAEALADRIKDAEVTINVTPSA